MWLRPLLLLLTLSVSAWACTVPVFRYALERWPPDPHVVRLAASVDHRPEFNEQVNVWIESAADQTEAAVIGFPDDPDHVWYRGPWNADIAAQVVDSPARRRIADLLLRGATAVVIHRPGPDASATAATVERLRGILTRIEGEVTLPEAPAYDDDDPRGQAQSKLPLLVRYPLLVLDREDTAEHLFSRQLSSLVADSAADGALTAIIFGQGRAIVLPEGEDNEDTMLDIAWFLCGPCSCQVKALNPGTDLLIASDWGMAVWEHPNAVTVNISGDKSFSVGGATPVELGEFIDLRAAAPTAETVAAVSTPVTAPTAAAGPNAVDPGKTPSAAEVAPAIGAWGMLAIAAVVLIGLMAVLMLRRGSH